MTISKQFDRRGFFRLEILMINFQEKLKLALNRYGDKEHKSFLRVFLYNQSKSIMMKITHVLDHDPTNLLINMVINYIVSWNETYLVGRRFYV